MLCHLNGHIKLAPDYTSKPAFKKADYGLINAFLRTIHFTDVFTNCCSTEDYWIAFKDIIQWNLGIRDTQGTVKNCPEFRGLISQVHFYVLNKL